MQSVPRPESSARLVLTIACHPQLRRIGERVVLGAELTDLSRLTPDFLTAEGRVP